MSVIVVYLLAVPLLTAIIVAVRGPNNGPSIRWLSLGSTVISLVLAVVIAANFLTQPRPTPVDGPPTFEPTQVVKSTLVPLPGGPGIQFYVGIDGLNVWLVLLTALLMVTAVLVSWTAVTQRVDEYYAWMLVLQLGMEGVFLAFDIVLFYVFFELTLVPLFFLIGIWGGPQRQYAARKFFIYTFAGSMFTLLGVLGIVVYLASQDRSPQDQVEEAIAREIPEKITFEIPKLVRLVGRENRHWAREVRAQEQVLAQVKDADARTRAADELDKVQASQSYWRRVQFWVFLAMAIGFAIKVPLVPLHTWLPLAHVEAPTAGSVLLAGVLLKIGAYGFLRLCVPLAPDASLTFGAPLIAGLAVIGILYGSLCALAQRDIKKLVAYSSVSHLGYCMLGMFALNEVGLGGSMLQMINHGLSTGALFLLVGMLYERYHTRKMEDYGGMGARLHLLAVFFVFITLTSIGLPGLNGFVSELLVMMGMYDTQTAWLYGPTLSVLAAVGVVLGAWYMLTLLRRVFFGPVKEPHHSGEKVKDLNGRELAALVPIAVCCVALGIYPKPFLDSTAPDLKVVARIAADARSRDEAAAVQPHRGRLAHEVRP
jgi:NADH-quinone oxidoreductase subunit M